MPWQEMVAMVGGELDAAGVPCYREVVVSVPRQSGKTSCILAWEIQRAVGWAERLGFPQRITYSAQTGSDARSKLLDDQVPVLERNRYALGISRVMRSNGHESVSWKNGSLLNLLASSEDSGHGKTLDLGVKDELFADKDLRRDQALIPAMATRPHAQLLTASTAGTPWSVAWNAKVAMGRSAVEADRDTGVAYFEFSAPLDADPGDPKTWWACMPALGRTIGLTAVEHAYQSMELGEFSRAWLNIPTLSAEQVIPQASWDLVNSNTCEAVAHVFGLDCDPERTFGAIVTAGPGPIIEVIDYREGVGWLVDRATELYAKHGCPFVLSQSGPAATFGPELERAGVPVVWVSTREETQASAKFFDRVVNGKVQVRHDSELSRAVAGAAKRTVGDAWAWGRKTSDVDICLLVAATLALWRVDDDTPDAAANIW